MLALFAKQLAAGPFPVLHCHVTVCPGAGKSGTGEAVVPDLQYPVPSGNPCVVAGYLPSGSARLSLLPQIGCSARLAKQLVFGNHSLAGQVHETVCPGTGKETDHNGAPTLQKVSEPKDEIFQSYVFVAVPHIPVPFLVALHSAESSPPFLPRHNQRAVSPGAGKKVNEASPLAHWVSPP